MEFGAAVTPPYVARPLRLLPFRGLRLAPHRVGDPSSIRAIARAGTEIDRRLATWLEREQLSRDAEPALYLHEYTSNGITIRGLIGLVDVSRRARNHSARAILPHEGIYPAQADDLADRMEQINLNPAPILLVHRAPGQVRTIVQRTRERPADHTFVDHSEQHHRLWVIADQDDVTAVNTALEESTALIADGHHRYAAYLRVQQRHPGGPEDLGLAMLVDQDDTPLFLGAIHRVLVGTTLEDLRSSAQALGWEVEEHDQATAIAALGPASLVATDSERWLVCRLDTTDRAAVELLHEDLIPELPHGPRRIDYHHAAEGALAQADASEHVGRNATVAVLMPALDVDQVFTIASDDRLLPEKATSFQPKPSLGVIMRSLKDDPPAN